MLIAGAGPAGAATAISLGGFAPDLRVALIDAPTADGLRVGEILPPQIRTILEHLRVWQTFSADGHRPSYRTVSAWGAPDPLSNEFLFQVHQIGWRLDRTRFDAMLLVRAAQRATYVPARVSEAAHDDAWRLQLDDGRQMSGRFLVDATGRGAILARAHGARFENLDRLVASAMLFDDAPDDGTGLLIETFADGWWYTAALPKNQRIVACMTDADLARAAGVVRVDGFLHALRSTRHVGRMIVDAQPRGVPVLKPAGSRRMTGACALPLLCVGDASSCFDPVSGQGIFKALRSGIFASYAIGDHLLGHDDSGLARYQRLLEEEFAEYYKALREYYALEQRFAGRSFWRRRGETLATAAAPMEDALL